MKKNACVREGAAEPLLSIGALARASGVPIKTIRYYSDKGLLPPRSTTAAGYRLYSREDRVQLEMIRTLRSLDVDLATILGLLQTRRAPREALALQLRAVESDLRRLGRTRAVLARALAPGVAEPLEILRRLDALAQLSAYEREAFLREALDRPLREIPMDDAWKEQLYRAAFAGLPEELGPTQWNALFELFDIVTDADFGARMAEMARSFWRNAPGSATGGTRQLVQAGPWSAQGARLVRDTIRALEAGAKPRGRKAQRLADTLVAQWAKAMGEPSAAAEKFIMERIDTHDPRAERLWELVAILRGTPASPQGRAYRFLFEALRARQAKHKASVRPARA